MIVSQAMNMFCPNCGIEIFDDIKFCKNCGANLKAVREALTGSTEQFDWSKTWVAEMLLSQEEQDRRQGITPEIKRNNEIKAGVITTLIGLGVMIFLRLLLEPVAAKVDDNDAEIIRRIWLAGVIPFLIGVGLLFNGIFLSKPHLNREGTRTPAPPPLRQGVRAPTTNQLKEALPDDFSIVDDTTAHLPEKSEQARSKL